MAAKEKKPPFVDRNSKGVNQAYYVAWQRITRAEMKLKALAFVTEHEDESHWAGAGPDTSKLRVALWQELSQGYKDLFMFGLIKGGRELDLVRKEVFKSWLQKKYSKEEYLGAPYGAQADPDDLDALRKELYQISDPLEALRKPEGWQD